MPFLGLLSGIGWRVWAGALIVLAVLAALAGVRHSGRLAERADQLRKNVEVKDAQLRAANARPRTDDDLDRVLRHGDF